MEEYGTRLGLVCLDVERGDQKAMRKPSVTVVNCEAVQTACMCGRNRRMVEEDPRSAAAEEWTYAQKAEAKAAVENQSTTRHSTTDVGMRA